MIPPHRVIAPFGIAGILIITIWMLPGAALALVCPDTADHYRDPTELYLDLDVLAALNPDIAEVVDYGDSYLKLSSGGTSGFDLRALRITNTLIGGTKPVMVLVGGYHGDEVQGPEIVIRLASWLVQGYGRDADATWLVDHHEVWIVPTVNPDRLGRGRRNANGVNLNRNHSFKWVADDHHGSGPASEPEVASLEALIATLLPDQRGPGDLDAAPDDASGIFLSVHTPWDSVGYPWAFTSSPAPNDAGLARVAGKLANLAATTSRQNPYLPGSASDWVYGVFGSAAFLYEMDGPGKPPYGELMHEIWPQHRPALIHAAKLARAPYLLAEGPEVKSLHVDQAVAGGVTLSAKVEDSGSGNQPIAEVEAYVDVPPWEAGASPVALSAADGSFDSVVEFVVGTLDTSSWSIERHIVFVRGRDDDGHWGPVSAVFVDLRPNLPPIIGSSTPASPQVLPTLVADTYSVSALDPDGDALDYTWSLDGVDVLPCGEASYVYQPEAAEAGVHRLTVRVSDGRSSASHSWEIVAFENPGIEIIDNVDANTSRSGVWSVSSGRDPYGADSLYSDSDGVFGWHPVLTTAGSYDVYAWWTQHSGRSQTVPYRVVHDLGTDTVVVDQRDLELGGRWNLLGRYALTPGSTGDVTVSSENGQASADAVRFVRADPPAPSNLSPIARISASVLAGDAPLLVDFDASASLDLDGDPLSYTWDFGDGETANGVSVSHVFVASGSYAVAMTVSDPSGATDTLTVVIDVAAPSGSAIIVDDLDANTRQTGTWRASSGANPYAGHSVYSNSGGTFTFEPALDAATQYDVYAWWTYHASRSSTVPYRITHDGGTATVIVDQHDQSLAAQWVLLGRFALTPGLNGEVTVSSENGQANADAVRLIAVGPPGNRPPSAVISATPSTGEAPLLVDFDASASSDPDDDELSYAWDFGDGASASGIVSSHTYGSAGVFTATLTVTDEHGAIGTDTVVIDVTAPPGGEIIVDELDTNTRQTGTWRTSRGLEPYAGHSVYSDAGGTFTFEPVLAAAGTFEVYAWWTYHANRSSTVPYRITHDAGTATVTVNQRDPLLGGRWNLLGTYVLTPGVNGEVTVSSENGQACADAVRLVAVGPPGNRPPSAVISATPSTGEAPLLVDFDASASSDPDDDELSYAWDFGDGASASGIVASHSYASAGVFAVTLTVTDEHGAIGTDTVIIDVTAPPGSEIIVDNLDANTRQTGTWLVSRGLEPYAGHSVYSDAGGTFTFEPVLAAAGTFEVYAWWTYHANRSSTVPYRITHDGGTATVIVDQHDRSLAAQWVLLGRFALTPGINGEITVSSENGQANADAVRIIRVD